MSVIAVAVKHMLAAGMSPDAVVAAIAEMEGQPKSKTSGAARTARWRDRHKASQVTESDGVTHLSPSKEVSPSPLQETQPHTPPSPPKGGSSPVRIAATKTEVEAIWEATPRLGRERSSRKDLERALTAAIRRGHDSEAVRAGIVSAYASPSFSGDHAKGVHRLIENDRWQSFTERIETSNAAVTNIEANHERMRAFYAEQAR